MPITLDGTAGTFNGVVPTAQDGTLGFGQTWQNVTASRVAGTSYQNTTGKPIGVAVNISTGASTRNLQVSTDGSTWVSVFTIPNSATATANTIVPPNHYYRVDGAQSLNSWLELR